MNRGIAMPSPVLCPSICRNPKYPGANAFSGFRVSGLRRFCCDDPGSFGLPVCEVPKFRLGQSMVQILYDRRILSFQTRYFMSLELLAQSFPNRELRNAEIFMALRSAATCPLRWTVHNPFGISRFVISGFHDFAYRGFECSPLCSSNSRFPILR
jgi:hypothetical protein